MHYPFPIGVSTVGKVITPGLGKPMYLATTTGTSLSLIHILKLLKLMVFRLFILRP